MMQAFISELKAESRATRALLAAVPEESYSWKPHEKSLAAGVLAKHIASLPRGIVMMANHDVFDISTAGPTFDSCSTREELLTLFDEGLEFAVQELGSKSAEWAGQPFTLKRGNETVFEIPRAGVIRTVLLNHLYHHRGQLSVYLRLLNVPVPSTYGPTADVSM